VAIVHDVIKKLGRVLPHPSAVFHVYASMDTLWVTQTLSHCTPMKRGKVSSNSLIHDTTQFGDSICPGCIGTFQMLAQQGSTDAGLTQHGQGLPPWSSKFMIQITLNLSHPVFSTFPKLTHPVSNFANISMNSIKPHRTSKVGGAYRERLSPAQLLLIVYSTKHSILSLSFFYRGKQSGHVRVFLVQLGFHRTQRNCPIINIM
jgi:hypothetical protein